MMKSLGPRAFGYGYPVPLLTVATYNPDGSVNVMSLHEAMRTNAGDLALCIGPGKKTHENIELRGAFTVALTNPILMAEVDYFGTVSGYRKSDKVNDTDVKIKHSETVDAPYIEGSPLVIECELIDFVAQGRFTTVLASIKNVMADEAILNERGRIDIEKTGMIFYEPFSSGYYFLGERVGDAWKEGKKYLRR